MALTSRISLRGSEPSGPEDFLSSSLGVIFPDDVTNQHGDAEHSLIYASPHLPQPLHLELADPEGETDRRLFSHYLWNASLLLAELMERDTLGLHGSGTGDGDAHARGGRDASFCVAGKSVLELGAGTALPSIMAGLLGAQRVAVTDYPAPAVLKTLEGNVGRNVRADRSPAGCHATPASSVVVQGHAWGELTGPRESICQSGRHAFDRVVAADCLWMPWQHQNLQRSISHFLKKTPDARCWVVAGFHTGRDKMKGFFDPDALGSHDLAVDTIWERDCNGQDREWLWDREEDVTVRKRWLAVALLKRRGSC
ncbi:hypothetical protein UVI_02025740 [Ustilaginoidea virens]|uniref:Nicotinamide N-methyltransferase n=1 Tax=Ustilaginoidea virens TaxID=1159556 RepID=A0A1B5KTE0_USTVR|nr:hypothetical protein UVI_02025740 [Ustilaginoidea virens]